MFILIAQNNLDIGAQALTISPVQTVGRLVELGAGAVLVIGALAVLMYLLLGGLNWVTAGGDKTKVETARTMITQAIIGLAVLASVFALFGVLTNFFGIRDRINIIGTPGAGAPGAGNPGGGNPGGGNPTCTVGLTADDGGAGRYCFVNGNASSARVVCENTTYGYPAWNPLCCLQPGATSPRGLPACP